MRKENQDACAEDMERGVFVVADGVGGAAAGQRNAGRVKVKVEKLSFVISSFVLRQPKRQVEVKVEVENSAISSFVDSSLVPAASSFKPRSCASGFVWRIPLAVYRLVGYN